MSRTDITASHAHPTTTAIQIPQIPIGNIRPPKNPNTTAEPLKSESSASDDTFRRHNRPRGEETTNGEEGEPQGSRR